MTDEELTILVRTQINLVEFGGEPEAKIAAAKFKEAGITANIHVGDPKESFTPRKTLEWYAGSLIDCVENKSWFAINSIINCLDKFAPNVKEVKA